MRRENRKRYLLPRLLIFSGPGVHCLAGPSRAFLYVIGKAKPPKGVVSYAPKRERVPIQVRHPPRSDGRIWRPGMGYRTPEEHGRLSPQKAKETQELARDAQERAVLAGIRRLVEEYGEARSGPAYAAYCEERLPWPLRHVTQRAFGMHLARLHEAGKIERVVASRGSGGRTSFIRLPKQPT